MSGFSETTAVTALGDGRYACNFSAAWSTLAGINGGILMATLVRAIEAEVGEGRGLRSLQCQFMRPPKAGDAEITIEVMRSGARATNLRLRIEQGGKTMLEGLAACFTPGLRELATWSRNAPAVEVPGDDPPVFTDPRRPSTADHVIYTPRIGPPPFSGTLPGPGEPARTGGWLELRDPQPVDVALLAFFSDAWWPAALGPLDIVAFNPTIDITFDVRTTLPPGGLPHQPLLLEALTRASLEGLCDEDAWVYAADGTLLAHSRQLAITMTPDDRPMVTHEDHSALE
ncbi:MAG: thioesterase family protein [Solirubrobacteraceae bacterium]|nr:thioesterase family protein [Solirubrobacteraceae bacterium]